jgi:hypothetical protein
MNAWMDGGYGAKSAFANPTNLFHHDIDVEFV